MLQVPLGLSDDALFYGKRYAFILIACLFSLVWPIRATVYTGHRETGDIGVR